MSIPIIGKYFQRTKQPRSNYAFNYGGSIPPERNTEGYLRAYGEIGWFHAVVFRIALGCSEVKWRLDDVSNRDKPKQLFKHPVLDLLYNINPFQTSNEFIALDTIYQELVGESFWILNYNALGEPAESWIPYPHKMSVVPDKQKFVRGYIYGYGADAIPFDTNEVIHFKYPNPLNQYRGLGSAQSIGVDLDAELYSGQWNRNFFYNSARPDGVIEFDYTLSDEQFDKLKKQWSEKYKGVSKAHQVGLLEGGGKYKQIQNTVKDMDFSQLKQLNRDIILGVYGMPLSVMGISENVNKANAEAGDYTFARWLVKPRLDWKTAKLQEQLIPKFRKSENLQLGFEEVVPETLEQKMLLAESGIRAGYLTINEARKLRGLDALPSGDMLLIPLNLIPTPIKGGFAMPAPKPQEVTEEPNPKSKGGEGSGHFGHEGRPGEVGGSAPSGGGGGEKPSGDSSGSKPDGVSSDMHISSGDGEMDSWVASQVKERTRKIPPKHLKYVKSIEANDQIVANYNRDRNEQSSSIYFIGEGRIVVSANGVSDIEHEIGHAVYDMGGLDTNQIQTVKTAYKASQETGKGFVSDYAKTNTIEYFAESYAAYINSPTKLSRKNPILSKVIKGIK